jgi:hypothetical protein
VFSVHPIFSGIFHVIGRWQACSELNEQSLRTMKTQSIPILQRVASALLLVLTSLTLVGQGSEVLPDGMVDPTTGAVIPIEPVQFAPWVSDHRLDVDFDGLPLVNVVEWLREVPEFREVNFVLSPKLRHYGQTSDAAIEVKLRSASLRDILNAIGIATGGDVRFEVRTPTLVALTPRHTDAPSVKTPQPPAYHVVNLREVLPWKDPGSMEEATLTIRDLVSQTLQAIHGNNELSPGLNYHQGSGILVIIGQPDAIRITMDIIRNLRSPDPEPARVETP